MATNLVAQNGAHQFDLTPATDTAAGGVFSIANPEGVDLWVTDLVVKTTTFSTGAANLDAGIAANGTTGADNLIDGLALGSAVKIEDNHTAPGSNGKNGKKWGASEFLTGTASATMAGLVGRGYVKYMRLP